MQSDYVHGRLAATARHGWAIVSYLSELVLEAAEFANKKSSEKSAAERPSRLKGCGSRKVRRPARCP
jgi:hypothetical protein